MQDSFVARNASPVRDVSHPRPGKEFDEVSSGDATRIRHATKIVDRLQLTCSGTIGDLSFHDVTDIIIEPADRRRSLFSVVAAAHCAFLKDSIDVFAETFVGSSADSDAAPSTLIRTSCVEYDQKLAHSGFIVPKYNRHAATQNLRDNDVARAVGVDTCTTI
jgi:hypothetical protein